MSLFTKSPQRRAGESHVDGPLTIPARPGTRRGAAFVGREQALRHSAWWAGLRLRASLISTFPVDVYRKVNGIQVEMSKPPILVTPGGERWRYINWMYASQVDLDQTGNAIGLITEVNALGLPARIDLQPIGLCTVIQRRGEKRLIYKIDGKEYDESKVWHERQYVVSGLEVGLSPLAYASYTLSEYLSIQDFALDWFGTGGVPKARLKNTARTFNDKEAGIVKDRFKASVQNGDLFVHDSQWEYDFMQAEAMGMEWLEARNASAIDIARYLDVPGDIIEAAATGSSITYASISQRNLQLLIMHIGPTVNRREDALSTLLPKPRFIKVNTDALLRMDPETRAKVLGQRLASRQITPSEGRAFENLPPFTEEDLAEIEKVYGPPRSGEKPVAVS